MLGISVSTVRRRMTGIGRTPYQLWFEGLQAIASSSYTAAVEVFSGGHVSGILTKVTFITCIYSIYFRFVIRCRRMKHMG